MSQKLSTFTQFLKKDEGDRLGFQPSGFRTLDAPDESEVEVRGGLLTGILHGIVRDDDLLWIAVRRLFHFKRVISELEVSREIVNMYMYRHIAASNGT